MDGILRHAKRFALFKMIVALTVCLSVSTAHADEYEQFANAKNAFDAGEYEQAVHRFEQLLASGIQNPALVLETHKLLGVSYLFLNNKEAAERAFTELLTKAPDYTLDPLLYPIEVIDFFTSIKQKNEKHLEELAQARALEKKKRAEEAERRRKEKMARLTRNIYVERTREKHSRLVALMPFGAGQFQNGSKAKGILFLSSELFLGATATTAYFLHSGLRRSSPPPPDERHSYEIREKVYRLTNHISLGLFSGMAIWGIVDSLYHFNRFDTSWKHVEEEDVPSKLRPRPDNGRSTTVSILPEAGGISIGVSGRF